MRNTAPNTPSYVYAVLALYLRITMQQWGSTYCFGAFPGSAFFKPFANEFNGLCFFYGKICYVPYESSVYNLLSTAKGRGHIDVKRQRSAVLPLIKQTPRREPQR